MKKLGGSLNLKQCQRNSFQGRNSHLFSEHKDWSKLEVDTQFWIILAAIMLALIISLNFYL